MLVKEMPQRHEQFLRMPDAASAERLVNVVSDHGPDGFPAMGLLQQIVCQGGGSDFRNVLVLADGGDLSCQSAKRCSPPKKSSHPPICAHRSKPQQQLSKSLQSRNDMHQWVGY
jgi:hypothetical protein